jgi:ABC-type amino acid transport system permease subunit
MPPLTSQYLNLTKNSSLAVAIGYPDLVSVFGNTTLNQTGQALEIIAIMMAVYLTHQPFHLGLHELVQPANRPGGALPMSAFT